VSDVDCLFEYDGSQVVPTNLARGPWGPDRLHGGAVAALIADALGESMSAGFRPVRFAMTFLKPAPNEPLRFSVTPFRRGRSVETLACSLEAATPGGGDSSVVAMATLLALRASDEPSPTAGDALPTPDSQAACSLSLEQPSFLGHGMEVRYIIAEQGATPSAWFRLRPRVRSDREVSPLARVVAASDLTGGVAMRRGRAITRTFVNVDVAVELLRDPAGEWIRLAAESKWGQAGFGHVRATAYDASGAIGSTTSVVVDQPESDFDGWSPRVWTDHPGRV
jgi:hypothetical protein